MCHTHSHFLLGHFAAGMSVFMNPLSGSFGIRLFLIGACLTRRVLQGGKTLVTKKIGSFVKASDQSRSKLSDLHNIEYLFCEVYICRYIEICRNF